MTGTPRFGDIIGATLPAWADDAACVDADVDAFFLPVGGDPRPGKRICGRCPVQEDCLKFAVEHDERYGIWGGATEVERRVLRRRLRRAA